MYKQCVYACGRRQCTRRFIWRFGGNSSHTTHTARTATFSPLPASLSLHPSIHPSIHLSAPAAHAHNMPTHAHTHTPHNTDTFPALGPRRSLPLPCWLTCCRRSCRRPSCLLTRPRRRPRHRPHRPHRPLSPSHPAIVTSALLCSTRGRRSTPSTAPSSMARTSETSSTPVASRRSTTTCSATCPSSGRHPRPYCRCTTRRPRRATTCSCRVTYGRPTSSILTSCSTCRVQHPSVTVEPHASAGIRMAHVSFTTCTLPRT